MKIAKTIGCDEWVELTNNFDRFLLEGKSKAAELKDEPNYIWEIPFTYTTGNSPKWNSRESNITWMHKDGKDLALTDLPDNRWGEATKSRSDKGDNADNILIIRSMGKWTKYMASHFTELKSEAYTISSVC